MIVRKRPSTCSASRRCSTSAASRPSVARRVRARSSIGCGAIDPSDLEAGPRQRSQQTAAAARQLEHRAAEAAREAEVDVHVDQVVVVLPVVQPGEAIEGIAACVQPSMPHRQLDRAARAEQHGHLQHGVQARAAAARRPASACAASAATARTERSPRAASSATDTPLATSALPRRYAAEAISHTSRAPVARDRDEGEDVRGQDRQGARRRHVSEPASPDRPRPGAAAASVTPATTQELAIGIANFTLTWLASACKS